MTPYSATECLLSDSLIDMQVPVRVININQPDSHRWRFAKREIGSFSHFRSGAGMATQGCTQPVATIEQVNSMFLLNERACYWQAGNMEGERENEWLLGCPNSTLNKNAMPDECRA